MKNIPKNKNMAGLHMIGDLQNCDNTFLLRLKVTNLKPKISQLIRKYGFVELGSYYHQFDIGATGIISLSESHVSVHTWPKEGYVSLDVFVCNYTKDNSKQTKLLFDDLVRFFSPGKKVCRAIRRYFEGK